MIGLVVPDLPYFLPSYAGPAWLHSAWSHSALGPVTTDLVFGVALFVLWRLVLVQPLTDLAPPWLRPRLPVPPPLRTHSWLGISASVVVGSLTHVVWDMFTHRDRWGTRHLGWLSVDVGGLPVFTWLQYGSGIFGLLVLLLRVVQRLRRTPPSSRPTALVGGRARAGAGGSWRWCWRHRSA